MKLFLTSGLLAAGLLLTACGQKTDSNTIAASTPTPASKVVVYSARKEHLIKPLFDAYTEKTGIKIEYITDSAGPLLTRLKSEGESSPADILLTTDVGNLWQAQQQDVLQSITSETLTQAVPAHLRDASNQWFGLTQRARTIVYASDRIKPEALSTYEALANPEWIQRLCLRTSKKVYNQSLVASFIAHNGEEKALETVKGWVANLAVAPFANDTAAMEAVIAGQCDVAIVNTYYFGQLEAAGKSGALKVFWPNQAEGQRGVHMNISGAGVSKHAKNREGAIALIEWLASIEAQNMLAGLNMEYPVNPAVSAIEQVKAWGDFKADNIALNRIAENQVAAVKLMDLANYK